MWMLMVFSYLTVAIIFNAILGRYGVVNNAVIRFLLSGFLIGIMMSFHLISEFGLASATIAAIIWFALVCELYIFLFTLSLGSVSIKILRLLQKAPCQESELNLVYQPKDMVLMRLIRLEHVGLITRNVEGAILLTQRGKSLIKIATFLKSLFHKSIISR